MALLGLGFNFGAKDSGLHKQMETLSKDFRDFGKEILSVQKLQGLLQALSFGKLDELKSKMSGLAGSGPNLTTSLEARFQSMGIEATKMGVKLGKTGRDLGRFRAQAASMADGMNISVEAAGAGIQAAEYARKNFKATGEALAKLGLKGARAFAAFGEMSGVTNIDEFVYELGQMQEGAKMSAQDMAELIAQARQFGATTGDVGAALQSLTAQKDALLAFREAYAGQFADDKALAEAAANFSKSTYRMANIFEQLGGFKKGEALQASQELADALIKVASDQKALQQGVGEYSELAKSLGVVGADSATVAEALKKGPTEFVAEIAKLVQSGKAAGKSEQEIQAALDAFYAHVGPQLGSAGPHLTRLLRDTISRGVLTLTKEGADAAKAAGKDINTGLAKAGKDVLGGISSLHTTGRTAQEIFERQFEQFEARFRKLGTMSTGEFLRGTQRGFNDMAGLLEHLAKEGGPLGLVVNKMADIEKFGIAGIFPPEMAAQVTVFGKVTEKLIGPLSALKMAGIDLLNPFGALMGVLAVLGLRFFALWAQTKDASKALELLAGEVTHFIRVTLPAKIEAAFKWLGDKARAYFIDSLNPKPSALKKAGSDLVDALIEGVQKAWAGLKEIFGGLVKGLFGDIESVDQTNNAQVVGAALGDMLRRALVFAYESVRDYLVGWWDGMIAIWSDSSTTLGEKLAKSLSNSAGLIVAAVLLAMSPLGGILASGLVVVYDAIMLVVGALGWWLIPIVLGVWGLTKALSKEGESFGQTWARVFKTIIMPFFSEMYNGFISFKDRILAPLKAGIDAISGAFAGLSFSIGGTLGPTTEGAMAAGRRIGEFFGKIVEGVAKLLGLVMEGVAWVIRNVMDRLSGDGPLKAVEGVVSAIGGAFEFIENTFTRIVDGVINFFRENAAVLEMLTQIGIAAYTVYKVIGWISAAIAYWPALLAGLTIGFLIDENATQGILDSVANVLSGVGEYIGKIVGTGIAALFKMIFGDGGSEGSSLLLSYLVNPFYAMLAVGTKVFSWFFEAIGKLVPAIGKAVNGIITLVQNAITGMLNGLRDALMKAFPEAADTIKRIFDGITTTINGIFDTVKGLVSSVATVIGTIAHFFGRAFNTAYNIITVIIDAIVQWALKAFQWVSTKVGEVMDWVYSLAPGLFDGIGKLWRAMIDGIQTAWNWVRTKISDFWSFITERLDAFFDVIDNLILSDMAKKVLPQSVVDARAAAKAERERFSAEAKRRASAEASAGMSAEAMRATRENALAQAYTFFLGHSAAESNAEIGRILASPAYQGVGLSAAMLNEQLAKAQAERSKRNPLKLGELGDAKTLDLESITKTAAGKLPGAAPDLTKMQLTGADGKPLQPGTAAAGATGELTGPPPVGAPTDDGRVDLEGPGGMGDGAATHTQASAEASLAEKAALESKLAASLTSLQAAINNPLWVATLYQNMDTNTRGIIEAVDRISRPGTTAPPATTGTVSGSGVTTPARAPATRRASTPAPAPRRR